jgi:DNA-binding CsgD family transcriptional regulator
MRAIAPLTDVVDAVYAKADDTQAWLDTLRASAERAFEGYESVQAYVLRLSGDVARIDAISAEEPLRSMLLDMHANADRETVRLLRPGVTMAARVYPAEHPARREAGRVGVHDVVAVMGFADPHHACAVTFACNGSIRVRREARTALQRWSAHLASGLRLRCAPREDEALLAENGAVLDASGEATARDARERLREAALRQTRARRESRDDPMRGLELWTAMVDGRWTLMERFDDAGKRVLVARRNTPEAITHRALSWKERAVVERVALGGTVRHAAYELGLPESTTSEVLKRALDKLGIRSRAELIELYASLVAAPSA